MKQHLNIDHEPAFHKIIIASIILHILFLSLVALPNRTKEEEDTNYFVKLVSPGETMNIPTAKASKILPDFAEETLKDTPEKKIYKEKKLSLSETVPEKHRKKTTTGRHSTSPPALLRHNEKKSLPLEREYEIRREFQEPEDGNLHDTAALERKYRGQSFEKSKTLREEQILIPDKKKPALTDRGAIERISRGPAFASKEIDGQQEVMIARGKRAAETERPVKPGKSGIINASDRTFQRKDESETSAPKESPAMITKPDVSGEPEDRATDHGRQDEQVRKGREGEESNTLSNNDRVSESAFSIEGVPLNELHACSHALDEKTLKNELLKILGSSRGCYSPVTGTYVFLGTNRYSSFDMMISPAAGRQLSNRCEELKNALDCLHLLKE